MILGKMKNNWYIPSYLKKCRENWNYKNVDEKGVITTHPTDITIGNKGLLCKNNANKSKIKWRMMQWEIHVDLCLWKKSNLYQMPSGKNHCVFIGELYLVFNNEITLI
jgi:hypothetical protein